MNKFTLARASTVANLLLFAANIPGGWLLFFTYGARPDGVVPALRTLLAALWVLGPLSSIGCSVLALIVRKNRWEMWVNAAISVAYALLWGLAAVM